MKITWSLLVFLTSLCFDLSHGQTCSGARLSAGCCSSGPACRVQHHCWCDEVCRTMYNDCCSDVPQYLNCNGPIRPLLFQAIMSVESNGDINAVGDNGASIGPFQIMQGYWTDAVAQDPTLTSNGQTYQNCRGEGSIQYSMRVMQAYMTRYATRARLGHAPTDEDIARIHNGGPNGFRNSNTLAYWGRVRSRL